jgi:hypothetical protein
MATTTTNFGWDIPQSTDLVKDGATAIAALGQDIDTAFIDLKGGTTGQVLAKASGTDLDFSWVAQDDSNAIQNAIVDAKGDLIAATAADTPARLGVGTNGQVLTADSTAATGLAWATPSTGSTGLTLINTTSFSGVSSVSLANDSFTSTYDNYKLILKITSTSVGNIYISGRLRASGSDNTNSNYTSQFYVISQTSASVGNDQAGSASGSWARFGYSANTSDPSYTQYDIFNPKLSARTSYSGTITGNAPENWLASGLFNTTTSFDSLSFFPSSGTITGSYSLYGYNK